MIRVLSSPSRRGTIGQLWTMLFTVRDADGLYVADPPVVTVTLPNATTATPEVLVDSTGCYTVNYTPMLAGRYTAEAVTTENGSAGLLAVITSGAVTPPTYTDLDTWLGGELEHGWTDAELTSALAAEQTAQMRVCRVPAAFPEDLREALLRRAARTLHMRRQLTAEPRNEGDIELPSTLPVAADPEIRRLEKPWRRLPIG